MEKKTYKWNQISKVVESPGIYAWYLPLILSRHDVESTITKTDKFKSTNNEKLAKQTIENFLEKHVFQSFAEDPYDAVLSGPLKPTFKGKISHSIYTSTSLIQRIYEEPRRLIEIAEIIKATAPDFSSPIYIGMAKNLNVRLNNHKSKIERYKVSLEKDKNNYSSDEEKRDHIFAKRIVDRKIIETELFVITSSIITESDIYKDIENLLNRINFPILGRN